MWGFKGCSVLSGMNNIQHNFNFGMFRSIIYQNKQAHLVVEVLHTIYLAVKLSLIPYSHSMRRIHKEGLS